MEKSDGPRLGLNPIGSLFSDAWKLYKERWPVLVEILLLPTLVMVLGEVLLGLDLGALFNALGALVVFVGYIILAFCILPVIFSLHHEAGVDASYQATMGWFWPYVWVAILTGLAFMGSIVMLFIPGIWLGIALAFVAYIFVIEQRRGIDALRQSKDYLKGYWWAFFGRSLLLTVIVLAITLVVELPIAAVGGRIAGSIVSFAVALFLTPFSAIYHYTIFKNLRALKPHLAGEHTKKGTGFIKTAAIVGIVAPIFLIIAAIFFIGLAALHHNDMYPNGGNYTPPPGYNEQVQPLQQ